MTTYMICDDNGDAITSGLQEHEAARIAQRIANRRSETVFLSTENSDDESEEFSPEYTAEDLVLCRSDTGDGGWSLHAPGSTDEQIASGDAPYLVSGPAEMDDETGEWSRPDLADYRAALTELSGR
jgi:hypothetical protein